MGRGFFYFRFFVDAHEGSTAALSDGEFRLLTRVWALARRSERPGWVFAAPGVGFDAQTLAAGAHVKAGRPPAMLERLVQLGFLRRHEGGVLEVVDWEHFNPPSPPSRSPEAERQRKRDARARTTGPDRADRPQDGPHVVRSGQPPDGERKASGIRSGVRNSSPHTPHLETEKDLDLQGKTTAAAERAGARARASSEELGPEAGEAEGQPPLSQTPAASGPGERRLPPPTAAEDAREVVARATPAAGPPAPTGAGEGGAARRRARSSFGDDDAPPPRPFLVVDHTELGARGAELRGLYERDLGPVAPLAPADAELREELERRLEAAGEGGVEAAAAWLVALVRQRRAGGGPLPGSVGYLVRMLRDWPGPGEPPGEWDRVLQVAREAVQPNVVRLLESVRGRRLPGGELALEDLEGGCGVAILVEHHQADTIALVERVLGAGVKVRFERPAPPARSV